MVGLEITARDTRTMMVLSARCRFCEFGKCKDNDEDSDRKRARTTRKKIFVAPYRSDNISRHLKEQHSKRYPDYLLLSVNNKTTYFDEIESKRPLASLLRNSSPEKRAGEGFDFNIHKKVVEVIINQLLCDDDDDEMNYDDDGIGVEGNGINILVDGNIINGNGINVPVNRFNINIPTEDVNINIPVDNIPEDGNNINIPEDRNNINIPEDGNNINIPEDENNINIREDRNNINIPEDGNNINIPVDGNIINIPEDGNRRLVSCIENLFILCNTEGMEDHYYAIWSNKIQFEMIVSFVSVGVSFRQCDRLLLLIKETLGLGNVIGNISVGKIIQAV